jgi:ABC-type transport system involved in multi-copper enzyme maturation permease subunit
LSSFISLFLLSAREQIRNRWIYLSLFFGLLIVFFVLFLSRLALANAGRAVITYGVALIHLVLGVSTAVSCAALLHKDSERRFSFLVLARPVSAIQYVAGRFAGTVAVQMFNWLLMSLALSLATLMVGGVPGGQFWLALFFVLLQVGVLGALGLLFSSVVMPAVAVAAAGAVYVAGASVSDLKFAAVKLGPVTGGLLNGIAAVVPAFERMSYLESAVYGTPVVPAVVFAAFGTAVAWIVACTLGAGWVFERRFRAGGA